LIAVDADKDSFETDVHVMKVRFKWFGKTGVAPLTWDLSSGRYTSRMGDSTILEDIDWERVAAGDPDDEWGETKESETDYPVPPEVEENEGVVVEESDEDIPF
jgi:hypothetical protein